MTDPTFRSLQILNAAAFVIVGLLALRDWWRGRDLSRAYLAIAMASVGLVALTAELAPVTNYAPGLAAVVIVLFMASAAGLLLYRDHVLRLPAWGRVVATLALTGTTLFALSIGLSTNPSVRPTTLQATAGLLVLVVWSACVIEPAYRLWRISYRLAAVQRARMRSLSAGYVGIVLVVLLSVGAAVGGATDPVVQYLLQLLALACVPLLYFRLAPPRWLRRIWWQAEEDGLMGAMRELLLSSPDRATLARRALDWGIRLVGGDAGLVADAGPVLLAHQGIDENEARNLLTRPDLFSRHQLLTLADGRRAIVHPLPLEPGSGLLLVVAGQLSPIFGAEEIERLAGYAAAITIALDRARVSEMAARKELELSEARDMAEAASRAKSEFLSRMSHELRTPLTAMMGFAELLELDELNDQQRRYTGTILKAGDHLLALINDVLDIARIEEGRLSMSLEALPVADMYREVFELTRPMADERGIVVRIDDAIDSLRVVADHQRLKQVLLNLVSNALKYNRPDGSVVLATERNENGRIRFTITDTGQGLRGDEIARLFSPFERLGATRGDIEGTGLGLALSKSLTEAMRGRIGVESTPGQGSTFWVELPRAEAEPVEADAADVSEIEASEVRVGPSVILYIEDTVSNIRLLEGILARRPNITLISAMQGSLAMELARQHHPDLIMLDVHLPDMEGLELLQQFRAEPATAATPVVMLSADATQHQVDRFLAAGAAAYMTKPIRVGLLLATLDKHLSPEAVSP